jgi:hypothetical protein
MTRPQTTSLAAMTGGEKHPSQSSPESARIKKQIPKMMATVESRVILFMVRLLIYG